jgi:hypothetical protein
MLVENFTVVSENALDADCMEKKRLASSFILCRIRIALIRKLRTAEGLSWSNLCSGKPP